MIRYVDKSLLPSLIDCCGGPFGCRIASTAEAYGIHSRVAAFWLQENRAALCKFDDVLVVQAQADADFEELSAFIPMTGAACVLCESGVARSLGLALEISGEIMKHETVAAVVPHQKVIINPGLRELHHLLCESRTESFVPPAFEPFYMDLSHRIRHGTAVTAGIREYDKLVACAVCTAKTNTEAIVSAVAVHPAYRRKGYGGTLLHAMLSHLAPRTIYILRAKGENEAFYTSCGFTPCGAFSQCTLIGG